MEDSLQFQANAASSSDDDTPVMEDTVAVESSGGESCEEEEPGSPMLMADTQEYVFTLFFYLYITENYLSDPKNMMKTL